MAQEGLHSIKTRHRKGAVIKIDLSKACDKVSWLYLRLLLTHLGFCMNFIRWVMSCITTISFVVLINGATSPFFHAERGLRQGCPLSPLLFLLVAEELSRYLKKALEEGDFKGIVISSNLNISHLLFVDDILIFCDGSRRSLQSLRYGLDLFHVATGMEINAEKSYINWVNISYETYNYLIILFQFPNSPLNDGVKYLGFFLKMNGYKKGD